MKSFVVPVGGSKLQRIFSAFSPVEGNDFLTFNQNLGDSASLRCSLRVLQSLSLATLFINKWHAEASYDRMDF